MINIGTEIRLRKWLLPVGAVAVVCIALLITGCGSETPTPTPPSAEALRGQVVQTLRGLSSVSFEVDHPNTGTDMGAGLLLNTVEGVASFPSSAKMSAKGVIERIAVSFSIVQTNDTTYFSGPIGDTWRIVPPGTLPFDFVGMNTSVADALAGARNISVTQGTEIDGRATFVLVGDIASDELRGLVPGAGTGLPLRIEGWVGQDDGLPWRVVLSGALIEADPDTMVRYLDLGSFDEPVSIEPPI